MEENLASIFELTTFRFILLKKLANLIEKRQIGYKNTFSNTRENDLPDLIQNVPVYFKCIRLESRIHKGL